MVAVFVRVFEKGLVERTKMSWSPKVNGDTDTHTHERVYTHALFVYSHTIISHIHEMCVEGEYHSVLVARQERVGQEGKEKETY